MPRILGRSRGNVLAVMPAQVEVLESKMQQTARSSQRTDIRWDHEPLWMTRKVL
jgi:hypothetical protein